MSFPALYEYCQSLSVPIGHKLILEEAARLAGVPIPKVFASSELLPSAVRGYFVAPNDDSAFGRQAHGAPAIVFARELNRCWRRFVVVKEAMHLFDEPLQKTGTEGEFAALLNEFSAPSVDRSRAMQAEIACFWMALGVLCPELLRQELARDWHNGEITEQDVAMQLRIPAQYVPFLLGEPFKAIISRML